MFQSTAPFLTCWTIKSQLFGVKVWYLANTEKLLCQDWKIHKYKAFLACLCGSYQGFLFLGELESVFKSQWQKKWEKEADRNWELKKKIYESTINPTPCTSLWEKWAIPTKMMPFWSSLWNSITHISSCKTTFNLAFNCEANEQGIVIWSHNIHVLMTGEDRLGNMELIFYTTAHQKYIETQLELQSFKCSFNLTFFSLFFIMQSSNKRSH